MRLSLFALSHVSSRLNGALTMVGALQRFRDLAVETYLWGQRCKWPLPRAGRRIVRKVFAHQVAQMIPDRTDEWRRPPFNSGVQGDDTVRSPGSDRACRLVSTPSPCPVPCLRNPLHPDIPSRLRCLVATGTLNIGGTEMVALLPGSRAPVARPPRGDCAHPVAALRRNNG